MLSTIVKISNVTNLSDARYCAGMGVEMLGFALDSNHSQYVTPEKFRDIRGWIAGVQLVGETDSQDPEAIHQLLEQYPLDALQISVPEMVPFLSNQLQIPLMLKVDASGTSPEQLQGLLKTYGSSVSYLLLESSEETSVSAEWQETLKQLPSGANVLLGFGLETIEQIQEFVDTLPISGISLRGSEEIRPGYKDYGMLMDILEALEVE